MDYQPRTDDITCILLQVSSFRLAGTKIFISGGEHERGLQAMFVMMNAARLHVGLQGLGLLEAAWQKADAHSRERRQMRAPKPGAPNTSGPDLIAEHPAMRRILDTQRAWIDGGRWTAPAQAFTTWALPEFDMRMAMLRARAPGS